MISAPGTSRHQGIALRVALFFLFTFMLLTHDRAWAVLDLHVKETLDVYAQDRAGSKKITRLEPGDRVVVSPSDYGEFKKVMLQTGLTHRDGYVRTADIRRSVIRERLVDGVDVRSHQKWGVGLLYVFTHVRQSKLSFSAASGAAYESDTLKGSTSAFGAFLDVPLWKGGASRLYYLPRSVEASAIAKPLDASSGQEATIHSTQSYDVFGLQLKYYGSAPTDFYIAMGVEYSIEKSRTLSIQNTIPIAIDPGAKRDLIAPTLSMGLDFEPIEHLTLLPEIRVGYVPSGGPPLFHFDASVGLGYAF